MNTKTFIFYFFLMSCLTIKLNALEIAGVNLVPTREVAGQELKINGAGLRTVTILNVKAYVGAFYSPKPLRSAEEVNASTGPFRFDFTFVRAFDQKDVTKAWTLQFKESASYTYPALETDVRKLTQYFGPIKKFGVESVEIIGNRTRIIDDGVVRGEIAGADFQKSFLSLWFGSNPVPRMKTAFLGSH